MMSAVFLTYFLKFFYHYKEDMCFNLLLSFNFNMPQILTTKSITNSGCTATLHHPCALVACAYNAPKLLSR